MHLHATQVEQAGIDVLLVGDSAAMVVHGHDTTLPITLDDMLSHCRAVARGALFRLQHFSPRLGIDAGTQP